MTVFYRCDNPKCEAEPKGYIACPLTHGFTDQSSGKLLNAEFHFCDVECMVEFMHATSWRGEGWRKSVVWPQKRGLVYLENDDGNVIADKRDLRFNWISVEDDLPNTETHMWAVVPGLGVIEAWYWPEDTGKKLAGWHDAYNGDMRWGITHWQEKVVPALPSEA